MVAYMEAKDKMDIFKYGQDLSIVEMGRDDINVSCTQGKIMLWFGRLVSDSLISQVVFGISDIYPSVRHEYEVICDFNSIPEYESKGYVLTSYAKTRGGYRAIFNVPFSKKPALLHFVKSIVDQLREKDVRKTLFWDGGPDRISLLYNELKTIDGWEIKRIEYRTEDKNGEEKAVK